MFYEQPTPMWAKVLDTSDVPHDYYVTFAAIVTSTMLLAIPHVISEPILKALYKVGLTDEIRAFMENDYVPEFKKATRFKFLNLT